MAKFTTVYHALLKLDKILGRFLCFFSVEWWGRRAADEFQSFISGDFFRGWGEGLRRLYRPDYQLATAAAHNDGERNEGKREPVQPGRSPTRRVDLSADPPRLSGKLSLAYAASLSTSSPTLLRHFRLNLRHWKLPRRHGEEQTASQNHRNARRLFTHGEIMELFLLSLMIITWRWLKKKTIFKYRSAKTKS